jgi:hypothetical protein
MSELSKDTQEALKKLFDSLPQEVRERCRGKAQQKLEGFEDAISSELEGKLNKKEVEAHQERRERAQREAREKAERKELEDATQEMLKDLSEVREALKTPYDKALHEHRDLIHPLYVRLKRFLRPRKDPDWDQGYPTGTRLNLQAAMQSKADHRQLMKLWDRRLTPQTFDYRFTFLVDISSSMAGEKAEETFKALVILSEVFQALKIPIEILAFSGGVKIVKSFTDRLPGSIQQRIAAIPEMVGGGTNDALALEVGYQRLKECAGKENFILVLTDGGSNIPEMLAESLRRIRKEGIAKVVAFGLGPDTEDVVKSYPHGYPNLKMRPNRADRGRGVQSFAEVLTRVAEEMIRNPDRF